MPKAVWNGTVLAEAERDQRGEGEGNSYYLPDAIHPGYCWAGINACFLWYQTPRLASEATGHTRGTATIRDLNSHIP